jgi:DUF1680 family protein
LRLLSVAVETTLADSREDCQIEERSDTIACHTPARACLENRISPNKEAYIICAREKVQAPFYRIHKIMAGMYDVYQYCSNRQAVDVLQGMAKWVDNWTAPIPEPHMQDILDTEYGGMNRVLNS